MTSISFYEFTSITESEGKWQPIPIPIPSASTTSPETPLTPIPIPSITLLTWNIWFDALFQNPRFTTILHTITTYPNLDIVALQEVTPPFIRLAKSHPEIQRNWIITDYTDSEHGTEIQRTWYGNIFLVRRGLVEAGEIRGWVKRFEGSKMRRFVVLLEISRGSKSLV